MQFFSREIQCVQFDRVEQLSCRDRNFHCSTEKSDGRKRNTVHLVFLKEKHHLVKDNSIGCVLLASTLAPYPGKKK